MPLPPPLPPCTWPHLKRGICVGLEEGEENWLCAIVHVYVYIAYYYNGHKGTSSSYRSLDNMGVDRVWFISLSSERLCIFDLHGYIFSLPFSELSLVGLTLDLVD